MHKCNYRRGVGRVYSISRHTTIPLIIALLLATTICLATIPDWAKVGNYAIYKIYYKIDLSSSLLGEVHNETTIKIRVKIEEVGEDSFKYSTKIIEGEIPESIKRYIGNIESTYTISYTNYNEEGCDIYMDPEKLSKSNYNIERNGSLMGYGQYTLKCQYHSNGWLKKSEGNYEYNTQFGSVKMYYKTELVESNFIGGGWPADIMTTTLLLLIVLVVLIAIVLIVRSMRAKRPETTPTQPPAPETPPETPPPSEQPPLPPPT